MNEIFKPEGRISRRKYLVLFLFFYFTNILSLMMMWQSYQQEAWPTFFSFTIVLIASIVVLLIQAIKRFHDIGMDWKYALYLLIPPPVNFIGFIWLAAKKGQDGPNEYGPDPRKTDLI
ncbi:uncharacterized membrane protein YhaH (DUF805 family) [Algoriphagus iocasae]|uniref:Uncharacterized membrane protein YhaH (DUF805 family) n=1 Tax=Algoriphagus iocasae TaxID=1836499 RepID=A0A841MLR9_9BACT|nr:DUF805 domain-containing protein [Algoriphagus iocasae]MBB6325186.1 uncharacterized membrane protein YhaH (DUF805 family) [Algoriphagus iocasae]